MGQIASLVVSRGLPRKVETTVLSQQLSVPRVTGLSLRPVLESDVEESTRTRWGGRPSLLGRRNTKWGIPFPPASVTTVVGRKSRCSSWRSATTGEGGRPRSSPGLHTVESTTTADGGKSCLSLWRGVTTSRNGGKPRLARVVGGGSREHRPSPSSPEESSSEHDDQQKTAGSHASLPGGA